MKLIQSIIKFINKLVASFDNHSLGFSARKLSAFFAIMLAGWETTKNANADNIEIVLTIWLMFALLCLSIITFQQVIEFKNGKETANTNTDTTPQ